MRATAIRITSALGLVFSVATLLFSLWRAGFFYGIFISRDDAFLFSSIALGFLSLLLGLFAKPISAFLRIGVGKRQVVFSAGDLDYHEAMDIIDALKKHGIYVWNDIGDLLPGDHFVDETKNRIEESDALIVRWSPEDSAYQADIIEHAVEKKVRIIPVLKLDEKRDLPDPISNLSGVYWQDDDASYFAQRVANAVRASARSRLGSVTS